jgi:CRP/FNR family transcriptional regulator, cyclic AMP receptor protein
MHRPMTSTSEPFQAETDETAELLAELHAFPGASTEELHRIAAAGTVITVPRGWSLIWERTPADKAYVVLDGTASVRHGGEQLAVVRPGELIGEMAIVNRRLRSATVVADSHLTVLHFTREAVERLSQEAPSFHKALAESTRLRG